MKTKKLLITILISAIFTGVFTACYTPNPIYGTWDDNKGNTITFQATGNFTAEIINTAGVKTEYQGEWSCMENVLVIKKDTGAAFKTEWDVRGSMLHLQWFDNYNDLQELTLYHTKK